MEDNYNKIPAIELYNDSYNPTIYSENCPFELPFCQTKESLVNVEDYKAFLDSAISRFRHSRTYKHYKGYLIDLGLDRCQVHSNIRNSADVQMATIEMHHNIITIYDIAIIISQHIINTIGYITTYDLVQLLKEEHKANNIPLVMLSLTPHQLYHNDPDFFIPINMCFGNWQKLLEKYHTGISLDIAYKILFYIKRDMEKSENDYDNRLLDLRSQVINWSGYNSQTYNMY